MHFANLAFAALLLLVPVLAALYAYGLRRRWRALDRLVRADLVPRLVGALSRRRQVVRAALIVAAAGLLAFGAMQPQWGTDYEELPRRGRDIYIVLDVSRSMLAEDMNGSRLDAAKAAVRDLVETLRGEGGYRLGLVVFAGRASLQSPLTLDYAFFLKRLELAGPDVVDRRGSALGDAVRKALYGFGALDTAFTDIIVLSDGEDHQSGVAGAARDAAAEGVGVYAIGVGQRDQGSPIPIMVGEGERQLLQYQDQTVMTTLQEGPLRELARIAKGAYRRLDPGADTLAAVFRDQISNKALRELPDESGERLVHRYRWFVVLALLLLCADMLLGDRPGRLVGRETST